MRKFQKNLNYIEGVYLKKSSGELSGVKGNRKSANKIMEFNDLKR